MKHLKLAAILVFGAGAACADPIEGVWKTEVDDGRYAHVTIEPCGANFCGVISKAFQGGSEYASPNKSKMLVRDMVSQGGGKYKGKVWRPSNDKIYAGKMSLSGDTLKMSGCVAGGLLCSSQTWTRIK